MKSVVLVLSLTWLCVALCFASSGARGDEVLEGDAAVLAHMEALLQDAESRLGPGVTVVDQELGLEYSARDGLQPYVTFYPDETGTVTLPDGTRVPPSPDVLDSLGLLSIPALTVYRKVVSYYEPSIVAQVTIPSSVEGFATADEAAYNYIGLHVEGTPGGGKGGDGEFGVWTNKKAQTSDKRWYAYANWSDTKWDYLNNAYVAGGAHVCLSISIPAAHTVDVCMKCGDTVVAKKSWTKSWLGQTARCRRVTSLLVDSGPRASLNNRWTSVLVGGHNLDPDHTWKTESYPPPPPQYLHINCYHPYYDERVCICVP